jgi:ADP-ribose pyrophosphatase
MEAWIDSEYLYQGKIVSLRVGNVGLDDGGVARREVVEHPGGVAIVPVKDGKVILVSQFRISVEREIIELPAGRLEERETPGDCARRELVEELGYHVGKLIYVGSYYSSAGFTNERMHLFLAFKLTQTERRPESDERLQTIEMPLDVVEAKLQNHEFDDSKTIIGLRELMWHREKHADLLDC